MNYTSNIALHVPVLRQYASKVRSIIEIGCEHGTGSTAAFDEGLPQDAYYFISVDLFPPRLAPKHGKWHFVQGDSRAMSTVSIVKTLTGGVPPDLIFIDTNHTRPQLESELMVWQRLAHPGTLWLFHDTWMHGTYNPMTDAAKEFAKSNDRVYEDISKDSHGLGAILPK